jgi:hypothetical protein
MTHAEQAAKNAVLLQAGAATVEEVIAWADSVIAEEPNPSAAFLELSTTPKSAIHDIISQLRRLSSEITATRAIRLAAKDLKLAIERGVIDVERAAVFTESFLSGSLVALPSDLSMLYSAHEEFYLAAAEGYGTQEQVAADFLDTLGKANRPNQPPEPTRPFGPSGSS